MPQGRARHQLRPRRHHQRGGPGRGPAVRPPRRGRPRRLRAGAAAGRPSAAEAAQRRGHAAPRRLDRGGPGVRGQRGGPAAHRLPDARRGRLRGQHGGRGPRPSWRSCGSTWTWPAGSACCTPRCARAPSSGPSCSYRGEVARRSTRLITAAFAAGLLESRLDQNVNIVNAELLARERGIEIVEQTSPQEGRFQHAASRPMSSPTRRPTPRPARCSATSSCGWCSWGRTISTPSWTA